MGVAGQLARAVSERLVEDCQAADRVPGIAAAVVRGKEPYWAHAVGWADTAAVTPVQPGTQFRIASLTKTFTAVLVLQLRDAGLLDLDDPLGRFVPETPVSGLRIRDLLAHRSGLQREPEGEVWRSALPGSAKLVHTEARTRQVRAPAQGWHYSNLGYGFLGDVVARLIGGSWFEAVRDRLLEPLGMKRTTLQPEPPVAEGLFVDPYADRVWPESDQRSRRQDAAGGLWSTVEDLQRWASMLADPDPALLAPATLAEMAEPQAIRDLEEWTLAWGLGFMVLRRPGGLLVGHGGSAPGYRSALFVDRATGVGAAVLVNTSRGTDPEGLAARLVDTVRELDPPRRGPWRPGPPVPAEMEGLLGSWWSEGVEYVFRFLDGRLQAAPAVTGVDPAVFAVGGPDVLCAVSGREAGERLLVERDADGQPVTLVWAGYPFRRRPAPFTGD